ncbi:MAG: MoxR family ATPase, partial [Methylophilus sp.]
MSDRQLADWRKHALTLEQEVNKVVVGQSNPIRLINIAIFARGHVLLEGDVGVGKTTLLRAFTRGIG